MVPRWRFVAEGSEGEEKGGKGEGEGKGRVNGISWSPRKIMVKDLRQRSGLA